MVKYLRAIIERQWQKSVVFYMRRIMISECEVPGAPSVEKKRDQAQGNYIKMLKHKIYQQEKSERSIQSNNKKSMIFPMRHFW